MLKLSHSGMTFFSGAIWMAIGIFLLQLGLNLLFGQFISLKTTTPLLDLFKNIFNPDEAGILITTVALLIGYLKGKHVLTKAANRGIDRILSLPNPAPFYLIYGVKYFVLIGVMILLGICLRYFPNDIRGAIDIAVGSALVSGSLHFFRVGYKLRKTVS